MYKIRLGLVGIFLIITNTCLAVELSMPSIFADHMVLQRDQLVPIWGVTEARALVEVEFFGQKKKTSAGSNGTWQIDLDPLEASSEALIMTITSYLNDEIKELRITDVLVGEVWICGGQSNMYRPFRMLKGTAVESKYEPIAEYLREEAATANDSLFRQFRVSREHSVFKEKFKGKGKWSKAIVGPVNEFCGTAYFFGRELRHELNVPVALLSCNLGATRVEPWIPMHAYENSDQLKEYYHNEISLHKDHLESWNQEKEDENYNRALADWEVKVKQNESQGNSEPKKPRKLEHPNRNRQVPSNLYNAMIHPMIPYAVKGAIWYQGESNTGNSPAHYSERLSAMIKGWREAWGQKQFFFYYCQLANYRMPNDDPIGDDDGWVTVSDQQRRTLDVPNTGMAILNDIGEAKDIHPKNKVDAGKRLSLWALSQAYGKDLVFSGPIYRSSEIKNNKVLVSFKYTGSGLMVGKKNLMEPTIQVDEPLQRFQICGRNMQWKWAEAKIVGKNKVEVWHKEIPNPVEVRYAWSSNPEGANLYNKEGLPASLFKTNN